MSSPLPNQPPQDVIAQAQLRKLELEIAALEANNHKEDATADAEQRKLDLEIQSLKWQNGLVYRLSQFATIFTILATLVTVFATGFGIWTAYHKLVTDKNKEAEIKKKEVTERTNTQYRSELNQLLQYPIDEKQTQPVATFLFRDLRDVIKNGYEGKEREERSNEVGFLLAQLVKSPEFNLEKPRNAEFDRKAMNYCDYYAEYLLKNPNDNMDIISKYKSNLATLHDNDRNYYESIAVAPNNIFIETAPSKDQSRFFQFTSLFHGYKKHVHLLNQTLLDDPRNEDVKSQLNLTFCWFYGATKNIQLTKDIYSLEENEISVQWNRCP